MFLIVIVYFRFNVYINEFFFRKIGVFFFVILKLVKRSSINRSAGILEIMLILLMKKEVIKLFLLEKVIFIFNIKWLRGDVRNLIFS